MDQYALIDSFNDTMELCASAGLYKRTRNAANSSVIYYEGCESKRRAVKKYNCRVSVTAESTFAEAKKHVRDGRVAVLNFANPENAGGGVNIGAMAQEECLCRSSNLYPCLTEARLFSDFYEYHRNLHSHFYSDRLIYTRGVTVFKTDDDIPRMLPRREWFETDVITCAAPYLGHSKYTNPTLLSRVFERRIKNIIEAALDNKVTTLILGAFGCGAFKNPARLVAKAFLSVIEKNGYRSMFKNIVFAIKPVDGDRLSANFRIFAHTFLGSLIANCPSYELPEISLPNGKVIEKCIVEFCSLPVEYTIEDICDFVVSGENSPSPYCLRLFADRDNNVRKYYKQHSFLSWQRSNPHYKKCISILGDSLSTLEGYNPSGYDMFYTGENCTRSKVCQMNHTWWGQVIELLGAELLVNNSFSGSRVSRLPSSNERFPSGCSNERTSGLHVMDTLPDVIIVYLGTNDWSCGTKPTRHQNEKQTDEPCDDTVFSDAYELMIKKLKNNYPSARICCCTLNTTFMSEVPRFAFPYEYGGYHIDVYNNIIREAVKKHGCTLIDLARYQTPYDTIDGLHPTRDGMKTISEMVMRELDLVFASILDS